MSANSYPQVITTVILGLTSLSLAGCFPSFPSDECYLSTDCVAGQICVQNTCQTPQGTDQGVADTGILDSSQADGEVKDMGFADLGSPDQGFPDATPIDMGPIDTGVVDMGPVDLGTPDMGEPDMGVRPDAGFSAQLTPMVMDFGVRPVNCTPPQLSATVQNLGVQPITVQRIRLVATGTATTPFSIVPINVPFTLNAAGQRNILIQFQPTAVGTYNATLEVFYGVTTPLTIQVTGRAERAPSQTDNFVQRAGAIDVLLVLDNSTGTMGLQTALSNEMSFMMQALTFEGWDYQIGVTTTDLTATGAQGAFVGSPRIVTPQLANPQTTMEQRVYVGVNGSENEQGLEAARLALSPPLVTTGANAGFLRSQAALLILIMSNEDDHSPMSVADYTSFIRSVKPGANSPPTALNIIASTATFCTRGDGTTARYAGRYLGASGSVGGTVSHICGTSWNSALTTFPAVTPSDTFQLSVQPDPATIEVRVDGSRVPNTRYIYQSTPNSIRFQSGFVPPFGSRITITYTGRC